MTTIFVTDAAGRETALHAMDGQLLMQVLREGGFNIKGSCEASLSCGSCLVHVDAGSFALLDPPGEDEAEMIDLADRAGPTSRFSCQIVVSPGVDGLKIHIPA